MDYFTKHTEDESIYLYLLMIHKIIQLWQK